jgi:endonuclease/exonuclease/phosphatase (EEP) superfamily protein YafD
MQKYMFRWETVADLYMVCLFGRFLLRGLFGDRWWWLFILNTYALYLFIPLIFVGIVAWCKHSRVLWAGVGIALILAIWQYGELFIPSPSISNHTTLTVMSYNVSRQNNDITSVLNMLRTTDADVVAIQELNAELEQAIKQNLAERYPYQLLDSQARPFGMGIISHYPLTPYEERGETIWSELRQVGMLHIEGTEVLFINMHSSSPNATLFTPLRAMSIIESSTVQREQQAREINEIARMSSHPLLVVGDMNATDQSRSYTIMTELLHDAWREAGWGMGNTFPADGTFHSLETPIGNVPLPLLPVRIDYILFSSHWHAQSAHVRGGNSGSDHRPLVVELRLKSLTSESS